MGENEWGSLSMVPQPAKPRLCSIRRRRIAALRRRRRRHGGGIIELIGERDLGAV